MPRRARIVLPGVPYHVVQRGNHREQVFFSDGDRVAYLQSLKEHADRLEMEVIAYCLMTNHVHLVTMPTTADGLHRALKSLNGHFAQRINRMQNLKGHLWQGRFFSSPLDSAYLINAVRYVELNPVRAGMAVRAEDYSWSSAAGHCGIWKDPVVTLRPQSSLLRDIADWSRWLAKGLSEESLRTLRQNGSQNLPCGSDEFIAELEERTGRNLRYRPRGAPPRNATPTGKGKKKGERPL